MQYYLFQTKTRTQFNTLQGASSQKIILLATIPNSDANFVELININVPTKSNFGNGIYIYIIRFSAR